MVLPSDKDLWLLFHPLGAQGPLCAIARQKFWRGWIPVLVAERAFNVNPSQCLNDGWRQQSQHERGGSVGR